MPKRPQSGDRSVFDRPLPEQADVERAIRDVVERLKPRSPAKPPSLGEGRSGQKKTGRAAR